MISVSVKEDLHYLTDNLRSKVEVQIALRPSLESALFKMGHKQDDIRDALDDFYSIKRTVH